MYLTNPLILYFFNDAKSHLMFYHRRLFNELPNPSSRTIVPNRGNPVALSVCSGITVDRGAELGLIAYKPILCALIKPDSQKNTELFCTADWGDCQLGKWFEIPGSRPVFRFKRRSATNRDN